MDGLCKSDGCVWSRYFWSCLELLCFILDWNLVDFYWIISCILVVFDGFLLIENTLFCGCLDRFYEWWFGCWGIDVSPSCPWAAEIENLFVNYPVPVWVWSLMFFSHWIFLEQIAEYIFCGTVKVFYLTVISALAFLV